VEGEKAVLIRAGLMQAVSIHAESIQIRIQLDKLQLQAILASVDVAEFGRICFLQVEHSILFAPRFWHILSGRVHLHPAEIR
jgi:hypothetical protein